MHVRKNKKCLLSTFLSTSAVFEIRILWSKINPFVMRGDILTANKIQVSAL